MLSLVQPAGIRDLSDKYKSTQSFSSGALSALLCSHMMGCSTLCDAARAIGWSPSVSQLQRATSSFSATRFMRRLRASILRRLKNELNLERYCLAIDDVPVEHFGKGIYKIGSWKNHGGGFMRGQRILVLALIDRQNGVALPLAYEVLSNSSHPEYKKATHLALEMLELLHAEKFPKLVCIFDSWFDSVPLINELKRIGVNFVIECRSHRKVKRCPAPGAKWKTWKDILHKRIKRGVKLTPTENTKEPRGTKYVAEGCVCINGLNSMLKAAAVYNNPTDGKFFAVYVTNDLKMSGYEIWSHSRARWHIEEMFRILKQDFSFGQLPLSGKNGTDVGVCLPFSLLVSFQLDRKLWTNRRSTVGSAVKEQREMALNFCLEEATRGSKRSSILVLKTRRKSDRNTKKPINPTANEFLRWKNQAA